MSTQPAHKIRIGTLHVTIWRNHGEKGNWYSVNPSRGYKADEGWRETDSRGLDDLLTMAKLLDLAHTIATKAGHGIHVDESKLVIGAIREVAEKVRASGTK